MHKDNQRLLSGSVQLKGRICGQRRLCVKGIEVVEQSGKVDVAQYLPHYFLKLQEIAYYLTHAHVSYICICVCVCVYIYIYIYFPFNTKGNLIYTLFDTLWAFQLVCFTWYTLAVFLYLYIESVTMFLQLPGIILYGYTIIFSQFATDGHLGFLPFSSLTRSQ